MFHRARGILGDHGLAEDAVHEAFLRITKHRNRFELVPDQERRYLCLAIVRNVSLNMLRSHGETAPLTDDLPAAPADIALGMDMAAAIDALDEGYQEVVTLRLRYGFDTAETARLLGLTQTQVRNRLSRARASLREALGDHNPKPGVKLP